MSNYSKADLEKIVTDAVDSLKAAHLFLMQEKNNVHERTVAAQLKPYLEKSFPNYNVDTDYNRMTKNDEQIVKRVKELYMLKNNGAITFEELKEAIVLPDIVVHHRPNKEHNLFAIEIKMTWKNSRKAEDLNKLYDYTHEKGLGYEFGLYLELGEKGIEDWKWFPETEENEQVAVEG